jgi:hypothetical protein
MHRSGTSLLTRSLEALGLFVGVGKEPNHEALFFHRSNDWILRQAGGAWDRPEPMQDLLSTPAVRDLVRDCLQISCNSPRTLSFLGLRRFLRNHARLDLCEPWGWKDPRTTVTLPLWLELFPGARLVHLTRHGVDVAASLRARERVHCASERTRLRRLRPWYRLRARPGGFGLSARCSTLVGAFGLWESYMRAAKEHLSAADSPLLELRFEDWVGDPLGQLAALADFVGLEPGPDALARWAGCVRAARAYAYRRDPELMDFAATHASTLAAYGY